MIVGIGIDSVEISRFIEWEKIPKEKLEKILSQDEIKYCTKDINAPQRFAARFATREAFFKALSQILPGNTIPFLTICKQIKVEHEDNRNPNLIVHWKKLFELYKKEIPGTFKTFISLTHTQIEATALVIVENRQ